jgi:hypothetical protein
MKWLQSEAETREHEVRIEPEDLSKVSGVMYEVWQRKSHHFTIVRFKIGASHDFFPHFS